MVARLAFFVVVVAVLIGILWNSQRAEPRFIVSGFIEADQIRVGSRIGGRVKRVAVEEGQQVAAAAQLVELDPFDLQARFAETEANYQKAAAHLAMLRAGTRVEEIAQAKALVRQREAAVAELRNGPRQQEIDAAVAELELAKAELELSDSIYNRGESLVREGAISRETFDRTTTERQVARARVVVKQQALKLLREGTRPEVTLQAEAALDQARQALKLAEAGSRPEEIAQAEAAVQAAEAARQMAQVQLDELRITSPGDLVVEALDLQPGDLVSGNAPVLTLLDYSKLWVRAYVPENRLDLRLKDKVPVVVDSFPGEQFTGVITFISSQAEFTPRNVQTPEERSKQVFRIKVRVNDEQRRLRPGMSADVLLDEVRHE